MGTLEGTIALNGLPPHRGLIVGLCFYPVAAHDAPAPYSGDPPAKAATDCHRVANRVDLHSESSQVSYALPFRTERPAGFYYLQVRAILFRTQADNGVLAQAEQFFYSRRPLALAEQPPVSVTLPASWPQLSVGQLHIYGVIESRPKQAEPDTASDPGT